MEKVGAFTDRATDNGEWRPGNPASGQQATPMLAVYFNMLQRELVNLVIGAGLALNKSDDSQLFKAVQAVQAAASTWAKITGKPTTRDGFSITDVFTKTETSSAIQTAISALVASSPAALDTLKELATALGNDPNFATTMTTALGERVKTSELKDAYGLGDSVLVTNLNNAPIGFFYSIPGAANSPGAICFGETRGSSGTTTKSQTCTDVSTGTVYKRVYVSGAWGSWGSDSIPQASEAVAGVMRISSTEQVDAGADNATAVTPKKLRNAYGIGNAPGLTNLDTAGPGPFIAAGSATGAPTAMAAGHYGTGYTTMGDAVAVRTQTVLVVNTGKMYRRTYGAGNWGQWGAYIDAGDFATQASPGIARIASAALIDAGMDDATIVTPLQLRRTAPVGASIGFYANSPPVGWLKENGAAVSRTTYADLFAVIGTRFGAGNGSTTFNLPDSRALFSRALDDSKGIDVGRANGSTQPQSIQGHSHAILNKAASFAFSASGGGNVPGASTTGATEVTGGTETRPANIAKLYCIKY